MKNGSFTSRFQFQASIEGLDYLEVYFDGKYQFKMLASQLTYIKLIISYYEKSFVSCGKTPLKKKRLRLKV